MTRIFSWLRQRKGDFFISLFSAVILGLISYRIAFSVITYSARGTKPLDSYPHLDSWYMDIVSALLVHAPKFLYELVLRLLQLLSRLPGMDSVVESAYYTLAFGFPILIPATTFVVFLFLFIGLAQLGAKKGLRMWPRNMLGIGIVIFLGLASYAGTQINSGEGCIDTIVTKNAQVFNQIRNEDCLDFLIDKNKRTGGFHESFDKAFAFCLDQTDTKVIEPLDSRPTYQEYCVQRLAQSLRETALWSGVFTVEKDLQQSFLPDVSTVPSKIISDRELAKETKYALQSEVCRQYGLRTSPEKEERCLNSLAPKPTQQPSLNDKNGDLVAEGSTIPETLNLERSPIATSEPGAVEVDQSSVTLTENGESVWVTFGFHIDETEPVNAFEFEYEFLGGSDSKGGLVFSVDGQYVAENGSKYVAQEAIKPNGKKSIFLGDLTPGLHTFAFTVEQGAQSPAVVRVKNIRTEYLVSN